MNLNTRLSRWEEAKLITPTQTEAIKAFEQSKKSPLFYYSLLFLSITCLGLGIISLIAANWDLISPTAKLLTYFTGTIALGGGLYLSFHRKQTILTEILLLGFALMILAGIGLIAQLYQLQPDGLNAFLLWSILTLPLLYFTRKPFLSGLWLLAFASSALDLLLSFPDIQNIRFQIENIAPGWLPWITVCTAATVASLLKETSPFRKALVFWMFFEFSIYIFFLEIDNHYPFGYGQTTTLPAARWYFWLSATIIFGLFWRFTPNSRQNLWTYLLGVLLVFNLCAAVSGPNSLLTAANTIALLLCINIHACRHGQTKLLNFCSILIALRFFAIYLETFDSLLTTGLGLITSGMVFILIAVIWNKTRQYVTHKMQEN